MFKVLVPPTAFALGLLLFGTVAAGYVPAAYGATAGWSQLTPGGVAPAARSQHSAIYDPIGDRVVVFGGIGESGRLNDVWALSLDGSPTWAPLDPAGAGPEARYDHSAIYDPDGKRMVVFGGNALDAGTNTTRYLDDVWALSLDGPPTWSALTPASPGPAARAGQTAVYDAEEHRMLVFGGASGANSSHYHDAWALSLTGTPAWTKLDPALNGLPKLTQHAAVIGQGHRLLVFGGAYEVNHALPGLSQAVWALGLDGTPAWTQLAPTGSLPSVRLGQSAVYDPNGKRMLVFGGYQPYSYELSGDLWALSTGAEPAWAQLTLSGSGPAARFGQAAVWDSSRDRMILVGGESRSPLLAYFNDVWAFGATANPPHQQSPTATRTAMPVGTTTATPASQTPVTSTATATGTPAGNSATATATNTVPSSLTPQSNDGRAGDQQAFLPAAFLSLAR